MKYLYILYLNLFFSVVGNSQTFQWTKKIGGSNSDFPFEIAIDNSGNIYIGGHFYQTSDFDPGSGVYNLISNGCTDAFIAKYDPFGNFIWAKSFGGPDCDGVISIDTDNYGNILITGTYMGTADLDPGSGLANFTSNGIKDFFILKLNSSGDFQWVGSIGGNGIDQANKLVVDDSSSTYVTGYFQSSVDFDPGPNIINMTAGTGSHDAFMLKLDSLGHFIWAKQLSGPQLTWAECMLLDNYGNFYIAGHFHSTVDFDPGPGTYFLTPQGLYDVFIAKYDTSCNFIWAKNIGGSGDEFVRYLSIDASGNLYSLGYYEGTADFDPGPNFTNLTSSGDFDIFIHKLNSMGDFIWVRSFGGTSTDEGWGMTISNNAKIISTGKFKSTVDFDPGSSVFNLTSLGNDDIFISMLDTCGNFSWAGRIGGPNYDQGISITSNSNHEIFLTGYFAGTVDFNPGVGTNNLSSANNSYDIFIQKLLVNNMNSNIISTPTNSIQPNCNGSVTVNPTGGTPPYNIIWSSGTTTNLCEGWYFVTITDSIGCFVLTDSIYINFVTGIEELNAEGIFIFPNPASDVVIINTEKEIGEIKIFDVSGRLIKYKLVKNKIAEIDIKELNAGIYFLHLNIENQNLVRKFVKTD